jgi:hypothetical protein
MRVDAASGHSLIGRGGFGLNVRFIVVGEFLRPVKTKAAFSAAVGANVHEHQDPVFQNSPALGAMDVHASTPGARFFGVINEETEGASHRKSIIALSDAARNPGRPAYQFG